MESRYASSSGAGQSDRPESYEHQASAERNV